MAFVNVLERGRFSRVSIRSGEALTKVEHILSKRVANEQMQNSHFHSYIDDRMKSMWLKFALLMLMIFNMISEWCNSNGYR